MSFKFEFKIDYSKLTALLDTFLKSHSDELTSIMGKCLVLEPSSSSNNTQNSNDNNVIQKLPVVAEEEKKEVVHAPQPSIDNRPLISDTIQEDPFENMFSQTRFRDRNNPQVKKGHMGL